MKIEELETQKLLYLRRTGEYGIENSLLMEELKRLLLEERLIQKQS